MGGASSSSDAGIGDILHLVKDLERLWLEAEVWAAGGFNRSATTANPGLTSPHQIFTGKAPPLQIVPFLQPGMMRVNRRHKSEVQYVACHYLNNGTNHSSTTVKVVSAATGGMCYTDNVVWTVPRQPLQSAAMPLARGGKGRWCNCRRRTTDITLSIASDAPLNHTRDSATAAAAADAADAYFVPDIHQHSGALADTISSFLNFSFTIRSWGASLSLLPLTAMKELDVEADLRQPGRTRLRSA